MPRAPRRHGVDVVPFDFGDPSTFAAFDAVRLFRLGPALSPD